MTQPEERCLVRIDHKPGSDVYYAACEVCTWTATAMGMHRIVHLACEHESETL